MSWVTIFVFFTILILFVIGVGIFLYYGNNSPPSTPSGVVATSEGDTLTITWNAARNADSYNVYTGSRSGEFGQPTNVPTNRINFRGFQPCQTIFIGVQSVNGDVKSAVTEISYTMPISAPRIQEMIRRGNILTIAFGGITGATSYSAKVGSNATNLNLSGSATISPIRIDVASLGQCVPIFAQLFASNGQCISTGSQIANLPSTSLPATRITSVQSDGRELVISWERINSDQVITYGVEVKIGEREYVQVAETVQNTYRATFPPPGVTTLIRIRATRPDGCSSLSPEARYPPLL